MRIGKEFKLNTMIVVSLFNGMSTGRTALENVGLKVDKYYSSEIKKFANELTQYHYPDTIQLGDVTKWREWAIDWSKVDLILSGSPCQDLSIAGKRKGLKGENSSLFWVFIKILNYCREYNPNVLFLQENVASAPKEDVRIMSEALGVLPVRINSNLVTAQNRDRYYWTNIRTRTDWTGYTWTDIPQPKDKNILLRHIIESGEVDKDKSNALLERTGEANNCKNNMEQSGQRRLKRRADKGFITCIKEYTGAAQRGRNGQQKYETNDTNKANCLTTVGKDSILKVKIVEATEKGYCEVKPGEGVDLAYPDSKTRRGRLMEDKSNALLRKNEFYVNNGYYLRLFTQTELERLQGFPDGWTSILSYNKASSLLGDGWTLPVIEHIFSFIDKKQFTKY